MTRFLLDTNTCIDLLRGRGNAIAERMRGHDPDAIAISSITLAELQFGAAKSSRPAHHESLLIGFCAPLAILPFDDRAAESYGRTRRALEMAGTPIGPLDTLIAAHALSLHLTLVTDNTREFERIAGLRVENWSRS
ncbi:MAG: type II toxin-antitoxin system VapC family toxin [Phycisphaerales bacterium]|nr:type II toxin-antitoxin system VapC family toxin [Phycisphaerales bacterium]